MLNGKNAITTPSTGGTDEAADNTNARAVYNDSTGAVAINGGTVEATGAGFALWNAGAGAFTVQRPPAVITGNVSPADLLP